MSQLIVTAAATAGRAALRAAATGIGRGIAGAAAGYAYRGLRNLILGPAQVTREGPRLENFRLQSSTPGAGVAQVFGRARIAGQIIWASRFRETVQSTTQTNGGKGGSRRVETTSTDYLYSISLAIGLGAGEITRIGRVWADGREISLRDYNYRLYRGDAAQMPDPLIEALEGSAPAFRDLAYIVFEDLPLAGFGNRLPQFNFEIFRAAPGQQGLAGDIRALVMIPGSGESVYDTRPVMRVTGEGEAEAENTHSALGETDFLASLDHLQASLPRCGAVSLVVSWFGNDLRAGQCQLRPGVEMADKQTTPEDWIGGGVSRDNAHLISAYNGAPAYGGTPSDQSVINAIREMNARGLAVTFYPFILMDIAPDNILPNPAAYGGGNGQGAYPWRGRIIAEDDANGEVSAFMGNAGASDFTVTGDGVSYGGPAEWSLRRMVLHYAHLCKAAGGVDAFLISSEMVALSTSRSGLSYPFVTALKNLAADVRGILGPATKISYAADWSEYFGHHPQNGSNDIIFHLDDLWADSNIDFIGIDNYMPLADWRESVDHLDGQVWPSIYDRAYLQSNIEGGEYYDFHYASAADRDNQIRTPVIDTAHGEDWVFRAKDIKNWWLNQHYHRPNGVREAQPTPWVPQSKPVRFTELGCGAVHLGANQPNRFNDPKSAEGGLPFYSNGGRDDAMQRAFLQAHLSYWHEGQNNPVSNQYGAPMLEVDALALYAWDARPFPDFPFRETVWADAGNWNTGHWLAGRTDLVALEDILAALTGSDITALFYEAPPALITGFVIDRPMALRDALQPLLDYFQLALIESESGLHIRPRYGRVVGALEYGDMVAAEDSDYTITIGEAIEAPSALALYYSDGGAAYEAAVAEVQDPIARGHGLARLAMPLVLESGEAVLGARRLLAEIRARRDSISFELPWDAFVWEAGDVISLSLEGRVQNYRIDEISTGDTRVISASQAPLLSGLVRGQDLRALPTPEGAAPQPVFGVMEAPIISGQPPTVFAYAYSAPWPGRVALYEDNVLQGEISSPALIGRLTAELPSGAGGRWLYGQEIACTLQGGVLSSLDKPAILGGAHLAFLDHGNGAFEMLQFVEARLQGDGSWRLSTLLRGQGGTEFLSANPVPAGARLVIFNQALLPFDAAQFQAGADYLWRAGPSGLPPESAGYQSAGFTYNRIAMRPLSPVHLRVREIAGDIQLFWTRRTRIGGDDWAALEVPLGEADERYQLQIIANNIVLREEETSAPSFVYSAAAQGVDWAGLAPGTQIMIAIGQISQSYGVGTKLTGLIATT